MTIYSLTFIFTLIDECIILIERKSYVFYHSTSRLDVRHGAHVGHHYVQGQLIKNPTVLISYLHDFIQMSHPSNKRIWWQFMHHNYHGSTGRNTQLCIHSSQQIYKEITFPLFISCPNLSCCKLTYKLRVFLKHAEGSAAGETPS